MATKNSKNFSFDFKTSKTPEEIFALLLDVRKWWSGLFSETITGHSEKVGDEFSFTAGEGMHYSKQRLIELIPNKKIVWLVSESKLTFLSDTSEWRNTKIGFDILSEGDQTKVVFTHNGLIPEIECFENCSMAWTQYLERLEKVLN